MFESCRAHFRAKCYVASVAVRVSLAEAAVHEVDRESETEREEDADPPSCRVAATALVRV